MPRATTALTGKFVLYLKNPSTGGKSEWELMHMIYDSRR